MDPGKPTSQSRPPPPAPTQHHVPALGTLDEPYDTHDLNDSAAPLARNSSVTAGFPPPPTPRALLPSPDVQVWRRGVDHPLYDPSRGSLSADPSQVATSTSSVGCTSANSRLRGERQRPGASLRSQSPAGYASDESSNTNSVPSAATGTAATPADSYPAMRPMKQHSVIVTEGRRYKPVADDLVPNRSFHPFSGTFELQTSVSSNFHKNNESKAGISAHDSSLRAAPPGMSMSSITAAPTQSGKEGILIGYLRGDTGEDQPADANDPINTFTYFVGGQEADWSSSRSSSAEDEREDAEQRQQQTGGGGEGSEELPHAPYGTPSQASLLGSSTSKNSGSFPVKQQPEQTPAGQRLIDVDEAERFVENLRRSFAMQRIRTSASNAPTPRAPQDGATSPAAAAAAASGGGETTEENLRRSIALALGNASSGGMSNGSFTRMEETAAMNYMRQPMHEALRCTTKENLDDDTVSFKAVWESFKSEALSRNILFGFRVTAFAVFPTFLLTEHPKTKDYFVAGSLLPIIAALFVRPTVGAIVFMAALALQSVMFFMTWGVIMNAVGAVNSPAGWWCGVIFSLFVTAMFGELPSKRLLMVYSIIIMQTEHSPGGDTLTFPCQFGLDFTIATGFALLATILPFPAFTYRQANEGIQGLHKLYSAGIGNAMKSFWAPVPMDARMALSQIPFAKIAGLTGSVRMAIHFTSYEPTEFNLNNVLRGQRLAMLQRIKMFMYAMAAASSQRLANTRIAHRSQVRHEIREFEKRMQTPAMELAGEVMKVLVQVGGFIDPKEVVEKVNFDALAERTLMFSDFIERERMEMLFLRKLPEEETNACLRCFAFHFSLIDISLELQRFEKTMKTFDPSQYPSLFRRALNFFVLDLWNNFWQELPHRIMLDRPYDVRLFKDAIRYTGAFAVACAFTLNYDRSNVYYFGMAILVRLAQQTASETLAIGVNRICGLCIGASLAYITHNKTHNTAELTLLTMTWCFIAMCFSQHPTYGFGAQYVVVTSIAGLRLAPTPALLLTRITDNVFAFISYYVICTFIFPVDPIRVLWNTRTKCFLSLNDLAQTIVTLGCAPITMEGKEVDFLVAKARSTVGEQQLLLKAYAEWMAKAATEPTLRGGEYPASACSRLRLNLNEIVSLEEALVAGVTRLHRPRDLPPSVVLRDIMELTRPFLLDAGRLIHQILQSMIDATERHRTWSMEEPLHLMWKAQLACRSLQHVTGNMQRNFYAAVQQVAAPDKQLLNVYLTSSMVEDALMQESDPSLLIKNNEDLIKRVLAMSFHMSKDAVVNRDDLQAFNAIIIVFELLLKTLMELLPPMIEIYEFEKSRHIVTKR